MPVLRSAGAEVVAYDADTALDVTEHDQLTRSLRLLLARYGIDR